MTDQSLQECIEILEQHKGAAEQLADMVKKLQEENKALKGQLAVLHNDREFLV
jgi:hypothetical protein